MTDTTTPQSDPVAPTGLVATLHSRRGFFAIGGAVTAGAVLAACGSDDDGSATTTEAPTTSEDTTTTTEAEGGGDAELATFAAGLELLAANTYAAALEAAGDGALGEIPPAVAEYATVAQAHHQAYSDALAEAAGGITPEVPADIETAVNEGFAEVTDVAGLAQFALGFELQAAATYLEVLPLLESEAAINLVGSILPVTRQRAAILHFVLGEYPVPNTFATTEESLVPG
ncbi:MAG: ferritin-like domain-containing protein [Acidimicrobiales bacterium]